MHTALQDRFNEPLTNAEWLLSSNRHNVASDEKAEKKKCVVKKNLCRIFFNCVIMKMHFYIFKDFGQAA
jgi:hypothetical protein